MAYSGNFYDNRTLFIKCESASVEQITAAVREALDTYQKKTGNNLDCRFRVNLVENKEGESYGIAFVFVTNPAVYHMLLGKNPDGSDRVEYRDDPSWEPPTDGDIVNDSGWATISPPVYSSNANWADIADMEDEYERKVAAQNAEKERERRRFIRPKIPVMLEPLMTMPPYRLTPKQIEEKRAKIIEDNEGKKDFDPSLIEVPEIAYFSVDRAMSTPVDTKFMANILKCKEVPSWITKEDLKMQFTPYATDSTTLQERFIKGRRTEETYPFVNINDDRVAFIIFDPSTHDAQFALHMMKKTVIKKKKSDGSWNVATLIFSHSFRTDRDLMADISQKPRPAQRRDNNQHNNQPRQPRDDRQRDNIKRVVANAKPQQKRQQAAIHHGNAFDALSEETN